MWDAAEFFAGNQMLSNQLRLKGLTVASLDILYWVHWRQLMEGWSNLPKNNPLDCNQSAGFSLPVSTSLDGFRKCEYYSV